ncbi:MAG TPA: flagellin, partial [Bacillota bacterium]|nr:flagellin [Bacillota bacterium]
QDGISLIQTAEGALNETHTMLNDMRRLVLQAHNGTNAGDDLEKIQQEINALIEEITGIAERAEFNTKSLLTGDLTKKIESSTLPTGFQITDFSGAERGTYSVNLAKNTTTEEWTVTLQNTADPGTTQAINIGSWTDDKVTQGIDLDFTTFGIKLHIAGSATSSVTLTEVDSAFEVASDSLVLQIGANKDQNMDVIISDMRSEALGLTDGTNNKVDVTKFDDPGFDFNTQLKLIDAAISAVSTQRSELGAYQNRLEHTINNLDTAAENLDAANSRIRDVDMALEMANFTRHQILQQAGTAMLAQANVTPQAVLRLLG